MATIAILSENPSEAWWMAARNAKPVPRELRALLAGKSSAIDVEPDRARELRAWCAALPGWDSERPALVFGGLVGRPITTARRSAGTAVTVRLAPEEAALLQALAAERGQTVAQVLRESALTEARREREPARAADSAKRRPR